MKPTAIKRLLLAFATSLAGSTFFGLEARAELAVTADLIKNAEAVCAEKPVDERSDCEQNHLRDWSDPVKQAAAKVELKTAHDFANAILKACKDTDSDRFETCSERQLTKYPGTNRGLAKATAFVGNVDREIKQEEQRHARTLELCRRSGIKEGSVRIGMTAQLVKDCGWGEPTSINRTVTAHRISEQWVYREGSYLYFDNGKLTTIQN